MQVPTYGEPIHMPEIHSWSPVPQFPQPPKCDQLLLGNGASHTQALNFSCPISYKRTFSNETIQTCTKSKRKRSSSPVYNQPISHQTFNFINGQITAQQKQVGLSPPSSNTSASPKSPQPDDDTAINVDTEHDEKRKEVERYRRYRANMQERSRMSAMCEALERLRTALPRHVTPASRKLSKIQTLRIAAAYINSLGMQLKELDNSCVEPVDPRLPPFSDYESSLSNL